ncbi:MAG: transposase [Actinomycetota bacterium]
MGAELVRRRLAQMRRLDADIATIDKDIAAKLEESETTLTEIPGVGPFVAARILGEVGDPNRIRSRAAFGVISGTAPLVASSGRVARHRLNRQGNRKLNRALFVVAMTQARIHPEARAYMARKRSEGKSYWEALRCLKRNLANVIYRRLVEDATRLRSAA